MHEPHVIRLRGPWTYEPLEHHAGKSPAAANSPLPDGGTGQAPDWTETLGAHFRGRVRFTRFFNCPTNLGADERVRLACDGADARGTVALNGRKILELDGSVARSCDITDALRPRNEIVAEIDLRLAAEEIPTLL